MILNPVLFFLWLALALCFLGLLVYRGQLTRYEEDQLFLNDEVNQNEAKEQTDIVRRVKTLEPLVRLFGGAAGLLTVSIVGMYVYSAWKTLQ